VRVIALENSVATAHGGNEPKLSFGK
jgi:hypothetical protein